MCLYNYIKMLILVQYTKKRIDKGNHKYVLENIFRAKRNEDSCVLGPIVKLVKYIRDLYPYKVINYDAERQIHKKNLSLGGGMWGDFSDGDLVTIVSEDSVYLDNPERPIHYSDDNYTCGDNILGKTYIIYKMVINEYGFNYISLNSIFTYEDESYRVAPSQIRPATEDEIRKAKDEAITELKGRYNYDISENKKRLISINSKYEKRLINIKNYKNGTDRIY